MTMRTSDQQMNEVRNRVHRRMESLYRNAVTWIEDGSDMMAEVEAAEAKLWGKRLYEASLAYERRERIRHTYESRCED